jgi:cysteine desulfuration protein SufE
VALSSLEAIREDFQLLDDWEDRYRYVIELGRGLPAFPAEARTEENKVRGCVSQVWLLSEREEGEGESPARLRFRGDSDALIVRGLIAVLLAIYDGKTAEELLAIDAEAILSELGLRDHLTPQRSNGLTALVQRIRSEAEALLGAPASS